MKKRYTHLDLASLAVLFLQVFFLQPKVLFIQFDDLICYLDFVNEFSFLWF